MSDKKPFTAGDKIVWLGSAKTQSYGNRNVNATVLEVKPDGKYKIKIFTPKGEMIKFVSGNSIEHAEK